MTNEVKNIPELRFPEFSYCWQEKQLGELASVTKLAGFEFTKYVKYSDFGEIPAIRGLNVKNGDFVFSDVKYIDDSDFSKLSRSKLESDNIVYTYVGTIGDAAIVPVNKLWYLAPNVAKIVTKNIEPKFLLQILLDSNFKKKEVLSWISTSSQPALSMTNIRKFKMQIPKSSIEQEKIGDFFSKLDRQIELEEQKLEKLEEQKKGYMQQIFSQQLRFKDENGNDYPGWKEYVLGETGNTYSGLSSKTKEDFGYGDSYFITYMNVFKNTIAKANMTEKVNIQENEKQNKVNYKDILFTTSSEVPEETGMSSIWLYKENNVYLNSFCFGFHVTCDDIEPIYLTRFLRSEKMRKQITILSQGSTRFNISKKEVMKLKIDVPNLEEQTKIVNFLSEYDSLIENQSSKIELLKERKQGFLQKMFV